MNCKCPIWKYKEIKTTCACGGIVYYQKINKIDENEEKKQILQKLKKEIESKRAEMACLRSDIKELEAELAEESCTLSNGMVVTKARLQNCDCSSCN